ncbi:sensor histidine kinase [Paenibacillus sp. GCM10027627]|uniref:sensor histidine kinase n=1 Tax=unclassified Paenibacillus TaxID=185978 RepID=UPI00363F2A6D
MIRRRLATRFALQLAAAGVLLTMIAIAIAIWALGKLTDIEIQRNFAPLGLSRILSDSKVNEQGLIVDPTLLKRLEEDGGWLQSLDSEGKVLQSFNAPEGLPTRYIPGQLIDFWIGGEPYPYKLGLWMQAKDGHLFTLLYGTKVTTEQLLQLVMEGSEMEGDTLILSQHAKEKLKESSGWVQVLNKEAMEVASWGKPDGALASYTLQELSMRAIQVEGYDGFSMETKYDESSGLTWVVQYPPVRNGTEPASKSFIHSEIQVMVIAIIAFLLSSLIVFILMALWYASRFGTPILLILNMIQKLGEGKYTNYASESGKSNDIKSKEGQWKRKYLVFGDIMESVQNLSVTLQEGRKTMEQTQRNREEWIAGVTHDMKTPIASIQGYAHMLEAEHYSWTSEEVRSYASKMIEKTKYMDTLINDLALTYRLRSGQIPATLSQEDICALLAESVDRAAAHPAFEGRDIRCKVPSSPVLAAVYPPWFDRILQNILANGLMHNPPETKIEVELILLESKGWRIDFRDDGRGMDQATMERLFERYYRGTSTESAMEGSGLGMAVTKELVLAMGGRISIDTEVGRGTVISLIWD